MSKTRKRRRSYRQQHHSVSNQNYSEQSYLTTATIINESKLKNKDLVDNYIPMNGIQGELRKIVQSNKITNKSKHRHHPTSRARARLSNLTNLGNSCSTGLQIDRSDSFTTQPLLFKDRNLEIEDPNFLVSPTPNLLTPNFNSSTCNHFNHFTSPLDYKNIDPDNINLPINETCSSLNTSCKNLSTGHKLESLPPDKVYTNHHHTKELLETIENSTSTTTCTNSTCTNATTTSTHNKLGNTIKTVTSSQNTQQQACTQTCTQIKSDSASNFRSTTYLVNYDQAPSSVRSRSSIKFGPTKRCPSTIQEEEGPDMDFASLGDSSFHVSSSSKLKKAYTDGNVHRSDYDDWTTKPLKEPCHRRKSIAEGLVTGDRF